MALLHTSNLAVVAVVVAAAAFGLSLASASTADCAATSRRLALQPTLVPNVQVPENLWLPASVLETDDYKSTEKWKAVQVCGVPTVDDDDKDNETCANDDNAVAFPSLTKITIGHIPQFSTETTLGILNQAKIAWNGGAGVWPQMSLAQRCAAIEEFLRLIEKDKDALATALMWEIGKSWPDAQSEITRTIQFGRAVITAIQNNNDPDIASDEILASGSHRAWMRRAALGIVLALGPYNYPINETYATLIPALLMGNICILKIPTIGGLVHLLTMQAFAQALPPGTIHFVAGSGRSTMPPLMQSGDIDALAFIGGSKAADELIKAHPHPHRLKVFLQLEANNMAIYLDDLFGADNTDLLDNALDQAIVGSLSYNGQRCTALKLHFVPTVHAKSFADKLAQRVEALPVGLPWQKHGDKAEYSKITPLPTDQRIKYMKELLDDALSKGANVINPNGGQVLGGPESTLMTPAVLYPVTSDMRIYHEEQFGPICPVVAYDDMDTLRLFARDGIYGQQASIFGRDAATVASLVDPFSNVFGKINLNRQCGRSPDEWPFSGRRSSAMGVMSVTHALREFSTPSLVSYGANEDGAFTEELAKQSSFLQPINP